MDRLKAPTTAGARVILENRINLCEKCSILANGTVGLQDDALQLAVTTVARAGLEVPVAVRLQLTVRHAVYLWEMICKIPPKDLKEDKQVAIVALVDFLIPSKGCLTEKDDLMRPCFANLCQLFLKVHEDQLESCELVDELDLKEKHDLEWQASVLLVLLVTGISSASC